MAKALFDRVREVSSAYIDSRIPFGEFQERFVSLTWDATLPQASPVSDLVTEIELLIAEYTNGHWTEDELREKIGATLNFSTSTESRPVGFDTGTSRVFSPIRNAEVKNRGDHYPPVDTRRLVAI